MSDIVNCPECGHRHPSLTTCEHAALWRRTYEKPLVDAPKPRLFSEAALSLADRIAKAVAADEASDGCDISGGLFGKELSTIVTELADAQRAAQAWRQLKVIAGYVANATDTAVTLTQDDATRDYIIRVDGKSYYGRSFEEAVHAAYLDAPEENKF